MIYTGDPQQIKKEIDILTNKICSCSNLNEAKELFITLDSLIVVYQELSGDKTNYYKKIKKNKYFYQESNKLQRKIYNKTIDNFIENKEFHSSLAKDILIEMKKKLKPTEFINEPTRHLKQKEILEILYDYLKKLNNGSSEELEKLIKHKRIFNIEYDMPYDGYTLFDNKLKKCNIFINEEPDSIDSMVTLIHELGHVMDFKKLIESKSQKDCCNSYTTAIYYEVMSLMYERDFIDYLIKNNIYKKEVKINLENHYITMFDSIEEMLILSNLNDYSLKKERFSTYNTEKFISSLNDNIKISKKLEEFPDPTSLDICDTLSYSYGGIISNYLLDIKNNSTLDYEKIFNDFYQIREKDFDKKIYDILQTDKFGLIKAVSKQMSDLPKIKKYH